MDQNQLELTLEESVKQVMHTLPAPLRNYLASGKYSLVAKNLMTKYGLHIDQGTVLEREIMLLLMGIENPDEFADALKTEALLSEDVMRNIMTDVNQEVFVPLQKQMREEASASPVTPPPPSRIVRTMAPAVQGANAPMPSYMPPRPEVRLSQPSPQAMAGTAPVIPKVEPRAALPPPPPMIIPTASLSVQNLASSLHDVIREVTAKAAVPMPSVPAPLPPKMAMPNSIPSVRPGHPTNLLAEKRFPAPVPEMLSSTMGNLTSSADWPYSPSSEIQPLSQIFPTPPVGTQGTARSDPRPIPPPTLPYSDDPYREPVN